jgi:hypothetical protein
MYVIFLVHKTDSLGVENILFLSFFLATRKRHTFMFDICVTATSYVSPVLDAFLIVFSTRDYYWISHFNELPSSKYFHILFLLLCR